MTRWQDDDDKDTCRSRTREQEQCRGGWRRHQHRQEEGAGAWQQNFRILYFVFFSCLYFAFFVFCIYFFNFLVFCILFCAWSQPRPLGRRTSTPASTRPSRPCVETWSSLYLIVVNYKPSLVIIPLVDVLLVQVVEWHHFLLGLHVSCFYSDLLRATQE